MQMFNFVRSKRIYLDYAAATPVRPEILSLMQSYWGRQFANPSAIHQEGVAAKAAVEAARLKVARTLGVRPEGVVWTASGTEANNLAIYGYLRNLVESEGKSFSDLEVISTPIEHPSVTEALDHLRGHGLTIKLVSLKEDGRIDQKHLAELLSPKTALVSFAYVNSEIGVVEDVKHITRLVRKNNEETGVETAVHLDAAQAPLWLSCKLEQLGVDVLTLDAGKCYGPKGVGVLARKYGVELKGIVLGGGQESGLRAGTENTPLIVGAAEAIVIAQEEFENRSQKVQRVRDYAIEKLCTLEGVELNGSGEHRVANNINVSIEGVEAEFACVSLDTAGIACSTKSACGSGKGAGSAVVRAITGSDERALTSLRFTLGEETKKSEIDRLVAVLSEHIQKTREFNRKLTQSKNSCNM